MLEICKVNVNNGKTTKWKKCLPYYACIPECQLLLHECTIYSLKAGYMFGSENLDIASFNTMEDESGVFGITSFIPDGMTDQYSVLSNGYYYFKVTDTSHLNRCLHSVICSGITLGVNEYMMSEALRQAFLCSIVTENNAGHSTLLKFCTNKRGTVTATMSGRASGYIQLAPDQWSYVSRSCRIQDLSKYMPGEEHPLIVLASDDKSVLLAVNIDVTQYPEPKGPTFYVGDIMFILLPAHAFNDKFYEDGWWDIWKQEPATKCIDDYISNSHASGKLNTDFLRDFLFLTQESGIQGVSGAMHEMFGGR